MSPELFALILKVFVEFLSEECEDQPDDTIAQQIREAGPVQRFIFGRKLRIAAGIGPAAWNLGKRKEYMDAIDGELGNMSDTSLASFVAEVKAMKNA